jgi:hypothetical protein
MSWITILLIGWPVVSVLCGPVVGRFVGTQTDNPADTQDPAADGDAKSGLIKSAFTLDL